MTRQRTLTTAHWGVYEVEYDETGKAARLHPFAKDPDPSPIGLHMLSDDVARLRVRRPAVRKGWLAHASGKTGDRQVEKRGQEPFVELPWDEALDLVASELKRVATTPIARSSAAPTAGRAPAVFIMPRARSTGS
jgi:biotin/methionine sulfoxide reductase